LKRERDAKTDISSRGEMKMSLRLMTYGGVSTEIDIAGLGVANILVLQVLEKLQFSVCALRQDGGAEGLHDLLDGHGLVGELVLG
jgi:hypothetical protein